MQKDDCIFCQIATGQAPCHKIWEDDKHLAFLGIFPNTEGFTVVIPKDHYPSYAFENDDRILADLTLAAKKVGLLLDKSFSDVGRTGMIFEGFGVDHLHAKLIPMHNTKSDTFQQHLSTCKDYYETYQGYLCTNDSIRADDAKLAALAAKIRSN